MFFLHIIDVNKHNPWVLELMYWAHINAGRLLKSLVGWFQRSWYIWSCHGFVDGSGSFSWKMTMGLEHFGGISFMDSTIRPAQVMAMVYALYLGLLASRWWCCLMIHSTRRSYFVPRTVLYLHNGWSSGYPTIETIVETHKWDKPPNWR